MKIPFATGGKGCACKGDGMFDIAIPGLVIADGKNENKPVVIRSVCSCVVFKEAALEMPLSYDDIGQDTKPGSTVLSKQIGEVVPKKG